MSTYSIQYNINDVFIGIRFGRNISDVSGDVSAIVEGFLPLPNSNDHSDTNGRSNSKALAELSGKVNIGDLLVSIDNESALKYSYDQVMRKLGTTKRPLTLKFSKRGITLSTQAIKGRILREINSLSVEISRVHSTLLQMKAAVGLTENEKKAVQLGIKDLHSKLLGVDEQLEEDIALAVSKGKEINLKSNEKKKEKQLLIQKIRLLRQQLNEATEGKDMIHFAVQGVESEINVVKGNLEHAKASVFVEQRETSKALLNILQLRSMTKPFVQDAVRTKQAEQEGKQDATLPPLLNDEFRRAEDVLNEVSMKANSLNRDSKRKGNQSEVITIIADIIRDNAELCRALVMLRQSRMKLESPPKLQYNKINSITSSSGSSSSRSGRMYSGSSSNGGTSVSRSNHVTTSPSNSSVSSYRSSVSIPSSRSTSHRSYNLGSATTTTTTNINGDNHATTSSTRARQRWSSGIRRAVSDIK